MDLIRNIQTSDGEVLIRPITECDSIEELTELLHRAYKVLADMGLRFVATYQEVGITRKRIANALCLVAEKDGLLVGTIAYYPPKQGEGPLWYNRDGVAHFGQFAVEPSLQTLGIGGELIRTLEEYAFEMGVVELALDTSEHATHLIEYYTKKGYRFIEYHQWDVTNYRSVVLSKQLRREIQC